MGHGGPGRGDARYPVPGGTSVPLVGSSLPQSIRPPEAMNSSSGTRATAPRISESKSRKVMIVCSQGVPQPGIAAQVHVVGLADDAAHQVLGTRVEAEVAACGSNAPAGTPSPSTDQPASERPFTAAPRWKAATVDSWVWALDHWRGRLELPELHPKYSPEGLISL